MFGTHHIIIGTSDSKGFIVACPKCHKRRAVTHPQSYRLHEALSDWMRGEPVHKALSFISTEARLQLTTGLCPTCYAQQQVTMVDAWGWPVKNSTT